MASMNPSASSSTSSSPSPTFRSSFTSPPNPLATFDVSTHGEGPFPKPLIREDSWNRIPLEYRPLTPQPGGRWRRSNHRDVPAEYRSGNTRSSQSLRQSQSADGVSEEWNQRRDHRRGMLSTSSMNSSSGDKTSWLAALVSTVKRPKHNRRETPPSINVSSDSSRAAITTPPLPPSPTSTTAIATSSAIVIAAVAAPATATATAITTATTAATAAAGTTAGTTAGSTTTTTTTTTSTSYLAPPPPTTALAHTDSVVWDPTAQVWRRLLPMSTSANGGRNRSHSNPNTPAFSFPYSDYTLMTESERLDYFLDHRVTSVVDDDDASFRASLREDSESGSGGEEEEEEEEGPPPPPYVQSQWEAAQERRIRGMRGSFS